jgi:hypothetical protein
MPALAPRAEGVQGQAPAPPAREDRDTWAFFKSPVGIAVIATFVAGTSYFIYSTQNDRINSPGKE